MVQTYSEQQLFIHFREKQLKRNELQAIMILQKFARMIIKRVWWRRLVSAFEFADSTIETKEVRFRRKDPKVLQILPEMGYDSEDYSQNEVQQDLFDSKVH